VGRDAAVDVRGIGEMEGFLCCGGFVRCEVRREGGRTMTPECIVMLAQGHDCKRETGDQRLVGKLFQPYGSDRLRP